MRWQHIFGLKGCHQKIRFFDKWEYTLFTNGYMSHIVSYNWTQTMRSKYHITFNKYVQTSNWNITLSLLWHYEIWSYIMKCYVRIHFVVSSSSGEMKLYYYESWNSVEHTK